MIELLDEIRQACARVAERARFVAIDEERIGSLAGELRAELERGPDLGLLLAGEPPEARAAYALTFDAINFGSGWWPEIRKRPGLSGSATMMSALGDRFRADGPWEPAELEAIESAEVAAVLGQDPEHELMALFASALRELGEQAAEATSWATFGAGLGESASEAVEQLASWPGFADRSSHAGHSVPLYKRAQIAVCDLNRAGARSDPDLDRLTLFADNLIPHVLRIDGALRLAPELEARIEHEELLEHGSAEEVEIRACAVHAVELLAAALDGAASPHELDELLWHRGRAPRYKARPRHRSRTTAY